MRTLEEQLHNILMDIAPDMHEIDEQAMIIAESAALYRQAESAGHNGKRAASSKLHEARMMDALLKAMNRLAQDGCDDLEASQDAIDGRGLRPDQIVHQASFGRSMSRTAKTGFGSMDILDDDTLAAFLTRPEQFTDSEYDIEDGTDEHTCRLYQIPGQPRHHSDSLTRY